ncbi:PrgI family protein [Streptomyces sp. TRM66268-LWL]|uniref:PrgI family protein n=1 Tax=Streptomyces polyasparticus TaxID=2767826 RepID=A0ABR7SV71_9ACTN|nr:PrgI family protein [Streptomyces polyasparticus]MBC9719385.1 PrgI family protein [Streptomyces polyasparticus]
MNSTHSDTDIIDSVRIPADVSRDDQVLGQLTARQVAMLATAAAVLYGGYWASRPFMAPLAYLVMILPIAGAVTVVAVGRREGIGLDRFLLAAVRHTRTPRRRVHAPEGVPPLPDLISPGLVKAAGAPPVAMRLPCAGITAAGVLDLRRDGQAALATCTSVNFDLRSAAEQQGLIAAFARWLNSLTGPTQLLVRCHRIDLAPLADRLQHEAPALPHPALEAAARAHADFLAQLAGSGDLLGRQIVLVAREEQHLAGTRGGAGSGRAVQRLSEAARALAPAEIAVTPLDVTGAADLVASACNPEAPPAPGPFAGDLS